MSHSFLDGAGWHSSKTLCVPPNITLVPLPPYSPELNPVERVWLYLKERFLSLQLHNDYNDRRWRSEGLERDWLPRVADVIPLDHEGQTIGSTVLGLSARPNVSSLIFGIGHLVGTR
jgi:hypothetical protein